MSIRSALATAAVATLALSGCVIETGPGPGPGPGPTIQIGSGAANPGGNEQATGILNGAGAPDTGLEGYIITASDGVFRVTWTGYREFSGSLFINPAALGRVYAGCRDGSCALATSEDAVVVNSGEPGRIDFGSFPASGKRSGFDVEVNDNQMVLDLLIEDSAIGNVRDPQAINFVSSITGQLSTAPDDPLLLIINNLGMGKEPQPSPQKNTGLVPAPQRQGDGAKLLWEPGQQAQRFGATK